MSDFDNKAKDWDLDQMKTDRARYFAGEIRKQLRAGDTKALEFGCGTGLLSFELKTDFKSITLVDESAGMIEVLKEKVMAHKLNHFKPLQADILSEAHPNGDLNGFNAIYTLMTMHHVLDLEHAFKTFHQILEQDGLLFIADLEKEDGSFHAAHPGFNGHLGFDRTALEALLEANGFKVERYVQGYAINKKHEGIEKSYPLFLMTARKV